MEVSDGYKHMNVQLRMLKKIITDHFFRRSLTNWPITHLGSALYTVGVGAGDTVGVTGVAL